MGTEDQDPLRPFPERLVGAVVDELDLFVADLAAPARQLVQHRLAKAQEVTEAAAGLRRQGDAPGRGEVFQPLQILGGGATLAHTGQPEVGDHRIEAELKATPPEGVITPEHEVQPPLGTPLRRP